MRLHPLVEDLWLLGGGGEKVGFLQGDGPYEVALAGAPPFSP